MMSDERKPNEPGGTERGGSDLSGQPGAADTDAIAKGLADESRSGAGAAEDDHVDQQVAEAIINMGRSSTAKVYLQTGGGLTYRTDRLDEAEVSWRLRRFAGSQSLERARGVLTAHGMVVLAAPDGTGRLLAALALLADWPATPLHVPVPIERHDSDMPLEKLLQKIEESAKRGSLCHVVHEAEGLATASPRQRLNADRLQRVLKDANARLVLTADPGAVARGDFGAVVVDLDSPDPVAVFDEYYRHSGAGLADVDSAVARDYVERLSLPGQVVAFLDDVAREGLAQAMASQMDARAEVRAWFDDMGHSVQDQLVVSAACFLDGVPERTFERCLDQLADRVRAHDSNDRAPLAEPLSLDQARRRWSGGSGLVSSRDGAGRFAEPRVMFRRPQLRALTVQEIWARYGHGLLQPLRDWIRSLVIDESEEVRFQAVIGLVLLAERRWPEVKESFLERWSKEEFRYQRAAANTLTLTGYSDRLHDIAIETAIDWTETGNERQTVTAVMALGGPLGVRHRKRAFDQLWFLTRRGPGVGTVAGIALKAMLATAVEPDQPELPSTADPEAYAEAEAVEKAGAAARGLKVLRATCDALRWSRSRGVSELRYALTAVASLLEAERFGHEDLVTTTVLRAEPAAITVVGELLAAILESSRHHHRAILLLCDLLDELNDDEGMTLARQLGAAVFTCWSAEKQAVLIPQIERELIGLSRGTPRDRGRNVVRRRAVGSEASNRVLKSFVESIGRF